MKITKKQALQGLCNDIRVADLDLLLLEQALTHTSYAYENKGSVHNERLEFLGDAVLELIVSTLLFGTYSEKNEGELTKARSHLVCEVTLASKASKLNLGHYLNLGKGERKSGGGSRASVLADAFEACLGAIYLGKGIDFAQKWVENLFEEDIRNVFVTENALDYKTKLQEIVYSKDKDVEEKIFSISRVGGSRKNTNDALKSISEQERIFYEIKKESGPEHEKKFWVTVSVDGTTLGEGVGRNKKEAEQLAARSMLQALGMV